MRNIKAILFDKDGTLMNFHSVWLKAMKELIDELSENIADSNSVFRELAESIGLYKDEITADGILAGGTIKDISDVFGEILTEKYQQDIHPEQLNKWVSEKMLALTKKYIDEIHPTTDYLVELLEQLNNKGIVTGIATADDYMTTEVCLEYLNIKKYFDFVVTSDRFPNKKPHPSVLTAFCDRYNLKPEEIAVIGDTSVDLNLAKNSGAGLAIGVLSGVSSRSELEDLADMIIPSVEDILNEDGKFIWDKEPIS